MMLTLQIVASVFALLGAWLVRKPGRLAPWAFVAWLVSNPLTMAFMAISGHWWFFAQHAMFLLFALDGMRHWLLPRPRLEAEAAALSYDDTDLCIGELQVLDARARSRRRS